MRVDLSLQHFGLSGSVSLIQIFLTGEHFLQRQEALFGMNRKMSDLIIFVIMHIVFKTAGGIRMKPLLFHGGYIRIQIMKRLRHLMNQTCDQEAAEKKCEYHKQDIISENLIGF